MTEYKMGEKSMNLQEKKEACVTFNRDVSCKKGSTSYAWHAAIGHTQRMERYLCKKIQCTTDAFFLDNERVFISSVKEMGVRELFF